MYAIVFSVVSFFVAMFGLQTIIVSAIPVLFFLYPLTIVIIILAFLDKYFDGRQCVYAWTIALTFITALLSGFEVAGVQLFGPGGYSFLPFHDSGMSWAPFAIVGFVIGMIHKSMTSK